LASARAHRVELQLQRCRDGRGLAAAEQAAAAARAALGQQQIASRSYLSKRVVAPQRALVGQQR